MNSQDRARPVTVLEPPAGRAALRQAAREVWTYRDLVYFLAWRDVKVRYKQATIGVAWAILQPLLFALVFSLFFGRLAKLPSDGVPYAVFAISGLLPWTFFANAVGGASESLVSNEQLLSKVWFPRLVIPLASLSAYLPDFAVGSVLVVGFMTAYGVAPAATAVFLPVWVALALLTAFAAASWLSALNVAYRDVRYAVPFLIQLWLFASPVVYPMSLVPQEWRWLYSLNPMVAVLEGFRWSLFGGDRSPWATTAIATVVALVVLLGGLRYFRRVERFFADVV